MKRRDKIHKNNQKSAEKEKKCKNLQETIEEKSKII